MQVTVKKIPESRVEITVVLPWEEWKKEEVHAVEHMAKNLKLPGFRRGKIPKAVLEGRFGRQAILIETAEHAVEQAYPRAMLEAKVEAIGRPEIKFEDVKENAPLTFMITTAVLPEVTLKPWQQEIEKINKTFASKKIEVADTEIEKELRRLSEMRAKLVTVNRPAQKNDSVEIDFTVTLNGTPVEGGTGKKHPLVLGSGVFIPGFEEALIGMQAGETKTITLSFPAEYHAKHLAGKPAEFTVTLLLVQERQLPEITDEFVQGIGHFQSVAELRKSLHDGILEEKKREHTEAHRSALLDQLISLADLEYPEVLVTEEKDRMLRQFKGQVEGMGFTWDNYLSQLKKTEAMLREEWGIQAKKRIAAELILIKLASEAELAVDSSEVEAEMNKTLQYYKNVKNVEKDLDLEKLYTAVQGRLLNEKVLTWLEKL